MLYCLIAVAFTTGLFTTAYAGPILPTITLAGDVDITGDMSCIDCIHTEDIAPLAVKAIDIGNNNIITEKIQNDAVTSAKISDGTIQSVDIAAGGVDTSDLAPGAVTQQKIAGNSITNDKIAPDTIRSGRILDGEIKTADIADSAVISNKIADGVVLGEHIGFYTREVTFGGLSTGQNNVGFAVDCDVGDFAISGGIADDNTGAIDEFIVKEFGNGEVENMGSHKWIVTVDVKGDSVEGIGITLHVVCLDFAPVHT